MTVRKEQRRRRGDDGVADWRFIAVPLISADPAWQGTTIEGAAASPAEARALILAGLDYVSRIGNA